MVLALLSPLSIGTVLNQENATAPIPVNLHRILIRSLTGTFYADFLLSVVRAVSIVYRRAKN